MSKWSFMRVLMLIEKISMQVCFIFCSNCPFPSFPPLIPVFMRSVSCFSALSKDFILSSNIGMWIRQVATSCSTTLCALWTSFVSPNWVWKGSSYVMVSREKRAQRELRSYLPAGLHMGIIRGWEWEYATYHMAFKGVHVSHIGSKCSLSHCE